MIKLELKSILIFMAATAFVIVWTVVRACTEAVRQQVRINDLQEKNLEINMQRWKLQNKIAELDLKKWQREYEERVKNEAN